MMDTNGLMLPTSFHRIGVRMQRETDNPTGPACAAPLLSTEHSAKRVVSFFMGVIPVKVKIIRKNWLEIIFILP